MRAIYTILLLVVSNVFMTLAWYGHLKLQHTGVSKNWPLIAVIFFSWGVALFEYMCQVPANRIGFIGNGGPFNLMQLKVIQEVLSLIVFSIVARLGHEAKQSFFEKLKLGEVLAIRGDDLLIPIEAVLLVPYRCRLFCFHEIRGTHIYIWNKRNCNQNTSCIADYKNN